MSNSIYPNIIHPCGLYQIVNVHTGKRYIGSSSALKKRLYDHIYHLRNNKHHCIHLQRAWNKYGKDNFIFKILVYTSLSEQLPTEQRLLESKEEFYNISIDATAPMKGRKLSPEHLANLKRSRELNPYKATDETKQRQSEAKLGKPRKPFTDEHKKNLSLKRRARTVQPSTGKHWTWCNIESNPTHR